ncbi:Ig-like domain-containing protein [Micrococcaceae bacterium Sec6.3]
MDDVDPADVTIIVTTAAGEEVSVPFEFDTVTDTGVLTVETLAEALGDELTAGFELSVYGDGQLAFGGAFDDEVNFTDIEAEELIPFEAWATVGTWSVTTDQNAAVEEPLIVDDAGVPVAIDATLIKRPEHGTVVIRASSDGYTPDEDFLGRDTVTVQMTSGDATRTVEFTVDVLDLPGDSTPTPIEPADPADPAEPAVEGDGHTVPERVETGDAARSLLGGSRHGVVTLPAGRGVGRPGLT